jgi:ribosomal protein L37AE/L43A
VESSGWFPLTGIIQMASCLKCGKRKLPRDKHGRYKCARCGVMPSNKWLDQGGNPTRQLICENVETLPRRKEDAVTWKPLDRNP